MLGKFRASAAAAGVALGSIALLGGTPATADPVTDTCVIVGAKATINNGGQGLYYPATDPAVASHPTSGPGFTWTLEGTCSNNGAYFTSSGSGVGWCGRSVGNGIGSVGGRNYVIEWQSAGSQLILVHPSARGSVNAQPPVPGSGKSCLDGTANEFLIDGVLTVLGV